MAIERDRLDVDILYVGAGPATLASAIRIADLCQKHGVELPSILVIEKAEEIGGHQLSGAAMVPTPIAELIPEYREKGFPFHHEVTKDRVYLFTEKRAIRFPLPPPQFANHGNLIVSLSEVVKWLKDQAEARGIEIYPGFPASKLLFDGKRVIGVQIQDRGIDKDGAQKSTFEAGAEIHARGVVLGDGPRGSCTKQLLERQPHLAGPNPQAYATGVKEIWKVKPENHEPGRVVHTLGWPADPDSLGGSWIYDMKDHMVSIGYVTHLDTLNPYNDPHDNMQRFKLHPWVRRLLDGAEIIRYGAKTMPVGGLFSQPRLYTEGALIVGDAASLCNGERLKGIHIAIRSGMLAAETLLEAVQKDDFSAQTLSTIEERWRSSSEYKEHRRARNFHAAFKWVHKMPRWLGPARQLPFFLNVAVSMITGGRGFQKMITAEEDHLHLKKLSELVPTQTALKEKVAYDNRYTFDKVTAVSYAGSRHEVDQPHHLLVTQPDLCANQCAEEYGNPCEDFCPADVYEMIEDLDRPGKKRLVIHHENCVHCKTCDIADPYAVITWATPEGGEGPDYTLM